MNDQSDATGPRAADPDEHAAAADAAPETPAMTPEAEAPAPPEAAATAVVPPEAAAAPVQADKEKAEAEAA